MSVYGHVDTCDIWGIKVDLVIRISWDVRVDEDKGTCGVSVIKEVRVRV